MQNIKYSKKDLLTILDSGTFSLSKDDNNSILLQPKDKNFGMTITENKNKDIYNLLKELDEAMDGNQEAIRKSNHMYDEGGFDDMEETGPIAVEESEFKIKNIIKTIKDGDSGRNKKKKKENTRKL